MVLFLTVESLLLLETALSWGKKKKKGSLSGSIMAGSLFLKEVKLSSHSNIFERAFGSVSIHTVYYIP